MGLPAYQKAVLRYVRRLLKISDMWLSVATFGELGTTISYRSARARDAGSRLGCILCRALDLFQKNHCDITLREHKG